MRVRTAILALVLAATVAASPSAKSSQLDSIRPFQRMTNVEYHGVEVQMRKTTCTAWAGMFKGERVWVTAGHCVHGREHEDFWVDGKPVVLLAANFDDTFDVAVLKGGPTGVQPFLLASATPQPLQPLWTAGHPLTSKTLIAAQGVLASAVDDEGLAIYNMAVAPGDSGSPIVDVKSGLVVGLMTQTLCDPQFTSWCPMSRGTTLEKLKAFLND